MKRIISSFLWLLCACSAPGQGTVQVVVPGGLANIEGNSSSSDLFVNGVAHLQQVYSSSEFASVGAPASRIDAISIRMDGATGQSFTGVWPGVTVYLSTSTRSPDSLSPVFSDNSGSDIVRVFGGPLGIGAPASSGVRSFQVRIPFTTPFPYDPAKGNLAVDILTSGTTSITLDAQLAFGDTVGRLIANPDALSGTADSLGLVTRFDITGILSRLVWLCQRSEH